MMKNPRIGFLTAGFPFVLLPFPPSRGARERTCAERRFLPRTVWSMACLLLTFFFLYGCNPSAVVFTVNDSGVQADDNPGDGVCRAVGLGSKCTLDAAIQEANNYPGENIIHFDLPAGDTTIFIHDELSHIKDPVVIDGTTQPGYAGEPLVRIENTGYVPNFGVDILGQATLRALAISGFDQSGIEIRNGSVRLENMRVMDNLTGMDCANSLVFITETVFSRSFINAWDKCDIGAQDSTFEEGGIQIINGTLTISQSAIRNSPPGPHYYGYTGSGIEIGDGSLATVSETTIEGNASSGPGGGIAFTGPAGSLLTVEDSILEGNTSGGSGGGVFFSGSSNARLEIRNTVISGNQAGESGGGVFVEGGSLSMSETTVSGNRAAGDGGGIGSHDLGSADISRSTFSANTAQGSGGGLFLRGLPASPFTLADSTVSGNHAAGSGGGIRQAIGVLALSYTTVAGNFSPVAGGIFNSATVKISDTVFSNNSLVNCAGSFPITSLGHNLDDGVSCPFTGPGDISGSPALLGPLALNGGPTRTHALQGASPAVNAGDDAACPPTDQRGVARPQGAHCDIGAFELENPPISYTPIIVHTLPPILTPTASPTRSLVVFDPVEFSAPVVYGAGRACDPKQVTVRVKISPAQLVGWLGLFHRLESKDGATVGDWSEGLAMIPQGDGWYELILWGENIPGAPGWEGEAWVAVQFVANGKDGEILARSEVYRQLTLGQCGTR
jgi:hypothetical protein